MKKPFILLTLLFCAAITQAQFILDTNLSKTNTAPPSFSWQKQLENTFFKQFPRQKPWQVALFLGVELRPTKETIQELQDQMQKGTLNRAAVLSFSQQDNQHQPVPTLYILSSQAQGTRVERISLPKDSSAKELMVELFSSLQPSPYLYTAVIINGRGDGNLIRYSDDKFLRLSELTTTLQEAQLYVDVLDMQACYMGSAWGVYQLAESDQVHYAIVSSQLKRGSRQSMYYRLLKHLHLPPQQAALAAHQNLPRTINFAGDRETHNSLVLDVSELKIPFQNWINEKQIPPLSANWHALLDVLRTQNTPAALALYDALEKATLAQWCFDAETHTFYNTYIPVQSSCIRGVSVNPDSLDYLFFPPAKS